MSIYIFFLMSLFFICLSAYGRNVSNGFISFMFISLFIFSAFRYDVGVDFNAYLTIFSEPDKLYTQEKGFMLINSLLKNMGFSFQSVVILHSALTLFFVKKFIDQESKNILLSVFIFFAYTPFFLGTFNTLRQALAIYIFLYATVYIRKRKFLQFLIIILLTSFFIHFSILIVIPLYFFCHKKIAKNLKFILCLLITLLGLCINPILEHTPYAIYLLVDLPDNILSPVFIFNIVVYTFILVFLKTEKDHELIYNLCFFSLCLLILCVILRKSPVYIVISRINEYFLPSIIILIPDLIFSKKNTKYSKLLYVGCLLVFGSIFILSILLNGSANGLVPYKNFVGSYQNTEIFDFCFFVSSFCFYAFFQLWSIKKYPILKSF